MPCNNSGETLQSAHANLVILTGAKRREESAFCVVLHDSVHWDESKKGTQ